ncbi:DUF4252 domain-containing protein [Gillisia sp. M10.2A]|uniref:DUF4252 domain-containing protein n=1 Tax=Gillisia lutea TaxID=2909668 RepID=A0ABS9EG00_9FLAO|nr:DUF4252 domain-containing protein [Gillisia lutea]MCF4101771.1 DUF4252 domain-containing protein [Gillisia lutea]
MKKLIIIAIIAMTSYVSNAQNFDKYENMKEVDAMVMTSKMFKLLAKVDLSSEDPEAQQYINLIENLKEIKMYTSSQASVRTQMSTDVSAYLKKGSLEQLMRVNEDGKNIKFYSKPGRNENFVSELFMFMEGEKDGKPVSVILSITGDIDLTQLSKLATDLKVPGANELKKVNKKS